MRHRCLTTYVGKLYARKVPRKARVGSAFCSSGTRTETCGRCHAQQRGNTTRPVRQCRVLRIRVAKIFNSRWMVWSGSWCSFQVADAPKATGERASSVGCGRSAAWGADVLLWRFASLIT